jgi:hypothetical protein
MFLRLKANLEDNINIAATLQIRRHMIQFYKYTKRYVYEAMQKIIPLHTLSISGSLTHAPQDMEIICGKIWRTFKARAINKSRMFTVGPCQNIDVYFSPPHNPSCVHHQKHVRSGMDAPYIQARRREGHEEEYKEDEIKQHTILFEGTQVYSTMKRYNTYT